MDGAYSNGIATGQPSKVTALHCLNEMTELMKILREERNELRGTIHRLHVELKRVKSTNLGEVNTLWIENETLKQENERLIKVISNLNKE